MNRLRFARSHLLLCLVIVLSECAALAQVPLAGGGGAVPQGAYSSGGASGAMSGAISPRYFGPTYYGLGGYGNGVYGPGYYGPGVTGFPSYSPYAMPIDPSLYYHTYPSYTHPAFPLTGPTMRPSGASWGGAGWRTRGAPPSWIAPTSPPAPSVWPSRGRIVIVHEKTATENVEYALNAYPYQIRPGYEQRFDDDRAWVIHFGGKERGKVVRYTLTAGRYRFLATAAGWDLVREHDAGATAGSP